MKNEMKSKRQIQERSLENENELTSLQNIEKKRKKPKITKNIAKLEETQNLRKEEQLIGNEQINDSEETDNYEKQRNFDDMNFEFGSRRKSIGRSPYGSINISQNDS